MKRIYIIIFALALSIVCRGEIVDEDYAAKVAGRALSSKVKRVQKEAACFAPSSLSASAPAYYVFQDDKGWVVIAGDDCAVPVLARGEGTFPDIVPEAMRELLTGYEKEIFIARDMGLKADAATRELWGNPAPMSSAGNVTVGPLTAAIKWNQSGSPFDDATPKINDKKTPAGCVASAIGIVFRYNKWPEKGKGVIPSYSYGEGTLPDTDINGYEYDWDNMPLNPAKEGTAEGKAAIAQLLAHIGRSVKMDYDVGSSGAYSSRIASALKTYFSYSNTLVLLYRNDFSNEEWFHMLRTELDKGRPLIYNASSSNGGHSFVCDGYDLNSKMISVNFGWGGGGNGWYVLNTVRNISLGDDAFHGGYPIEHEAVFGMVPDTDGSGSTPSSYWIGLRIDSSKGEYGMSYSSQEPVVRGQNFGVELNRFANFYNVNTMKYRMVLTDRDNNVKEQISDEKEVKFLNGSTMSKYVSSNATCRINSDFVIGDRIRCQYSTTGGLAWYPMGCTTDQISSTEIRAMHEMGVYDLDIIDLPSDLRDGQALYLNVLYGGHKAYKSVVWTYDGRELESKYPSVWLKKGPHTLEAKVTYVDDTVRTIVSEFTVTD